MKRISAISMVLAFAILTLLAAAPANAQFASSPNSLQFPNASNSQNPNIGFLFITAPNTTTFNLSTSTSNNLPWLSAAPAVNGFNQTPASVQVTVNPAGLAAGTYSGQVTISSPTGSPAPLNVPITLVVGGGGSSLSVIPSALTFNYQTGQAVPAGQTITATSPSFTNFTAGVTTTTGGTGWLNVSPGSGSGTSFSPNVFVTPTSLGTGVYSGNVIINGNGQQQSIPVTLNVNQSGGGGNGTVTPSQLSFSYVPGGVAPNGQTITYNSATSGTVSAFVNQGGNFLTVTPQTVGPTTSATFTVNVISPQSLGVGTYSGNIVIIPPSPASQINVPVTLTVSNTGGGSSSVTATPSSVTFTYAIGGFSPQAQNITLSSATPFTYTATVSNTSSIGWLSVLTPSGGPTTSAALSLSVNPGSLAPGAYVAFVQVAIAGQGTLSIPVYMSVGAANSNTTGLAFNPNGLTFNVATGSAASSQSAILSSPAGLSFTTQVVPSNTNFLSVTPSTGVTNGATSFTVTPQTQFLSAGTYPSGIAVSIPGYAPVILPINTVVGGGGGGTGTGGVSISPGSVVFNYTPGGATPQQQTITLTTPSSVSFTATANGVSSGQNWLAVGPNQGLTIPNGSVATAVLQVAISSVNLPVGSYQGTINVSTSAGNASIPVTFNVGVAGTTQGGVSPSQLSFGYQIGQTNPPAQLVSVTTQNGASSTFTAAVTTNTSSGWLTVAPSSGQAPGVLAVNVNPANLAAGIYTGSVNVTLAGSGTSSSIPVTLTVSASPVFRLSLNSATFNYQLNGTVPSGQGQGVDISSTGSAVTVLASASSTGNWLTVTPQSITTPGTVNIGVNAAGLAAGTYTGTVTFSSGQQSVTFPVTLNVSSSPLLNAFPSMLTFNSPIGTGAPAAQSFSIGTTGSSVAVQPTAVTMNGSGWLSVSPVGTLTTPNTYTVTVNNAGLAADTYYGAIVVNTTPAGQAANAPVIVPIVYTNAAANGTGGGGGTGPLAVAPSSLTFVQVQGGAAPATQALNLTSSTFVTYSASASTQNGGSWLSVSPITGSTPGALQVSVNASNLALGTYTGFVVITSTGSTTPIVVPVTLSVINAPTVTAAPTSLNFDYQVGAGSPGSQAITINATSSTGAVTVPFNATFTTNTVGNWLNLTPTSGNTPGTLTASVTPANLAFGTYTGTITVTTGVSSPIVIPVNLTVRQRTQILAQLADGSNWKTSIVLVNLDTVPAPFTLRFYDDNGSPLSLATDASVGRVASIDGTIPVGGTRTIQTLGTDAVLSQGWIELTTQRTIGGTAVFRQTGTGRPDQEGGVSITSSTSRFVMPFDNLDNFVTSMAIVNTNAAQNIVVSLVIRDESGNQLGTDSIVMAARSHQAFALTDRLPATRGRRGSVEFSTNGPDITGLGLRFNPGGAFTSFPVQPK